MIYCEIDKGKDPEPTMAGKVHAWYGTGEDKGCADVSDAPISSFWDEKSYHPVPWGKLCPSCGYRPWCT